MTAVNTIVHGSLLIHSLVVKTHPVQEWDLIHFALLRLKEGFIFNEISESGIEKSVILARSP